MIYLQAHRSFLPLDLVCYWSSVLNSAVQSLHSSAPKFLFDSFLCFISLLYLSFCSCIVFLIYLSCLSMCRVAVYASLEWLFWILCQALPGSPIIWDQFVEVYHTPFAEPCFSDTSWSLKPCTGVCTFEEAVLSLRFYRPTSMREDFHLQVDAQWSELGPQV